MRHQKSNEVGGDDAGCDCEDHASNGDGRGVKRAAVKRTQSAKHTAQSSQISHSQVALGSNSRAEQKVGHGRDAERNATPGLVGDVEEVLAPNCKVDGRRVLGKVVRRSELRLGRSGEKVDDADDVLRRRC